MDFFDRRKLLMPMTFAGRRDEHPGRMPVLSQASTTKIGQIRGGEGLPLMLDETNREAEAIVSFPNEGLPLIPGPRLGGKFVVRGAGEA